MEKYEESSSDKREKDSIKKQNIQSVIRNLSKIEKSFDKVTQDQEEAKSWIFLKDIDLIMALDAVVYRAKIDNKLCNVKMIISSVKYGFGQLKCIRSGCSEKAIMCHKRNNDIPADLYWEKHSNLVDPLSEDLHYFDAELKNDLSILKSLEKLLVVLQEQMEYLISENDNKDMSEYSSIKEKLDEEYGVLKNTLNDMTVKAKQIVEKEAKTDRARQYEPLSFVKSDSEKWIQSILRVFRLVFEANMKPEIEVKLKAILNWSAGIEQYKEEFKSSSIYSIPDDIYGKEFKLCKIPIQTLKKLKELEKRVQNLAKAAISYQKVRIS